MLRPKFDSTFFVAFKLTHEALDAALKKASELNITQYRVLVKLLTSFCGRPAERRERAARFEAQCRYPSHQHA